MQKDSKGEKVRFYLFINSKSGGEVGKKYLEGGERYWSYHYGEDTVVLVRLVDLFNEAERAEGVRLVEKGIKRNQKHGKGRNIVIVCGGDGTVLWVLGLLAQSGINLQHVEVAIIPIGTGNDFSKSLGWGGSPLDFTPKHTQNLKKQMIEWMAAEQGRFDIWQTSVHTYHDGTIIQIRDKREVDTGQQTMERGLCNYLGIGIDARISYSVQKHRQSMKCINLMLYGCIGLCKFIKWSRPIHEAIHTFKEGDQDFEEEVFDKSHQEQDRTHRGPLISSKDGTKIRLKPKYTGIIALNSPTYMAGVKNVWNTSKIGIINQQPPQFSEQRCDDGKIEFIAFKSELGLALERVCNSGARVAQGQGPYRLTFNRTENDEPTYVQIDGEAVKVRQLREVVIQKHHLIPREGIRVLIQRQ